ncbi:MULTISPECIES: hypothetical protein [unclassified Paenibacillus]|uniref:hypothetical protein n=1 Tax=unclassified Paenibacillus TaxID=185978 RepID=UPI0009574313|nr:MULTISPECIES: hypothetical protein [unclassified Paenibacillus]ASS65948.1 hypothetical protein CIC07_07180 [Paenibacillus sp. RUD330]SIQ17776.1 hypothetical protein SAMN05880555_0923 [Paenibacillus sp. RU4X]SIQ39589.1 hypothetical protein SAMN05880570_0922 [Paenibacillus sp. RU4T]
MRRRYGYSIGLAVLSAAVLAAYAGAAGADGTPPYKLVTLEGNAEVMKGFVLEGLGSRLSADGRRERTGSRFLSAPFEDLIKPDRYSSERNQLIVAHRSFMRGHRQDDSFYRDGNSVIGADMDDSLSSVKVRILDLAAGSGSKEFTVPVQTGAAKADSPLYRDETVVDIQQIENRIHLLVRGQRDSPDNGPAIWTFTDYIVDKESGKLLQAEEMYRTVPDPDPYTETTVELIAEVRELEPSPSVMLNVKTVKRKGPDADVSEQDPVLKGWRIIGYDYASGDTWDLPEAGMDRIKQGLAPRLHDGKLYAFNERNAEPLIHVLDTRTGEPLAEPLQLLRSGSSGLRSIRLEKGLVYDNLILDRIPTVMVYEEKTRKVIYRGAVERTDSEAQSVDYQYFQFNYYGE